MDKSAVDQYFEGGVPADHQTVLSEYVDSVRRAPNKEARIEEIGAQWGLQVGGQEGNYCVEDDMMVESHLGDKSDFSKHISDD